MSEQEPQEISADDVQNAMVEGQQDVGAMTEDPEQVAAPETEEAEEEKSLKAVGERTDAAGRSLFPWESTPKQK